MVKRIIIILIFAVFLISCGKEKRTPNDKVKIKIAHWFSENKDLWEEAIQEFEKVHPEIDVDQELVVYQLYVQKLLASSAASVSIGDLIIIEDWFAQDMLDRDYFIDQTDFVRKEIDTSFLFTGAFKNYRNSKNELIGVPITVINTVLFYNKDLFDAAKVTYPDSTWTYTDLLETAKKLTKDNDNDGILDQWGLQMNYSPLLDCIIYSFGGGILSEDLASSIFDSQASIEGLNYFVDLYRKYKVSASPESAAMTFTIPFLTGKFGMVLLSDFKMKFREVKFKWDIALPPIGKAGRRCPTFSQAFGIPKQSIHQKESQLFLKWFINELPLKYSNLMEGLLPINKKNATSPDYLYADPKCNRMVSYKVQEKYSFNYLRPGYFELRDYGFQPEVEKAISGKISVQECAREGSKKIAEILQRNKSK